MKYLKTVSYLVSIIILLACQNTANSNKVDLPAENDLASVSLTDNSEVENLAKNNAEGAIDIVEEKTNSEIEVVSEKVSKETKIKKSEKKTANNSSDLPEEKIKPVVEIKVEPLEAESFLNTLLQKHVSTSGVVRYSGLKAEENKLDQYLQWLDEASMEGWSSNKSKAHWINAYNAYTLKLILKHYPVKSIKDITENGNGAWDIQFCKVAGNTYSLNHIEHEILLKKYHDPRIHVGVNCASYSCPPLAQMAFTESNVDATLETLMKKFINDSNRNKISSDSKAEVSELFNWFKGDFTRNGTLIAYINKYSNTPLKSDAIITYLPYNWDLNDK